MDGNKRFLKSLVEFDKHAQNEYENAVGDTSADSAKKEWRL